MDKSVIVEECLVTDYCSLLLKIYDIIIIVWE